jgi:hypothetical protein
MVRRSVEGPQWQSFIAVIFRAQSGAPLTDGKKGLTTSTADGALIERRGCNQRQSATDHPAQKPRANALKWENPANRRVFR